MRPGRGPGRPSSSTLAASSIAAAFQTPSTADRSKTATSLSFGGAPQKPKQLLVAPSDRRAFHEVLSKDPEDRRASELGPILRVLNKIDLTAVLAQRLQIDLAQHASLAVCRPAEDIFHQGDIGNLFYIILTGSVSVKIEKTDGAIVARSLEAGQSFGELALLRAGGRRTATVVAAQTTELLTIDGVLYGRLLAKVQSQELADKVTVLSNCSCFRGWEPEQLHMLAGRMELRKMKHGSVVMGQGDQATAMFFVKCGRVRVLRCIKCGPIARMLTQDPLLSARYPPTNLHALHEHLAPPLTARSTLSSRPSTAPYSPRPAMSPQQRPQTSGNYKEQQQQPAAQGDVWIEMGTLGQHESFGEIAAFKGATRSATVVCLVPTELLIITRHDLLTSVRGEARARLESMSGSYMSDAALLRKLRDQLSWERFKHKLVAGSLYESKQLQFLAPLDQADQHICLKSPRAWR